MGKKGYRYIETKTRHRYNTSRSIYASKDGLETLKHIREKMKKDLSIVVITADLSRKYDTLEFSVLQTS